MRFKFRSGSQRKSSDIIPLDITPLIDVVLLLLIFFMLTSSFIIQPGIKVDLPKAVTSEVIHERNIVVTITGENLIYVHGEVMTTEELVVLLQEGARYKKPVLIKADRSSSLGRVVHIWDLCREAGVTQINIATNQEVP